MDHIPGIGLKRKKRLLEHFGDVETISKATEEEILSISGITRSVAKNVVDFLRNL